jgi:hypothetical protein
VARDLHSSPRPCASLLAWTRSSSASRRCWSGSSRPPRPAAAAPAGWACCCSTPTSSCAAWLPQGGPDAPSPVAGATRRGPVGGRIPAGCAGCQQASCRRATLAQLSTLGVGGARLCPHRASPRPHHGARAARRGGRGRAAAPPGPDRGAAHPSRRRTPPFPPQSLTCTCPAPHHVGWQAAGIGPPLLQGHDQGKVGERQSLPAATVIACCFWGAAALIVPLARHSRSSSATSGPVPYSRYCRSPWL